MYSSVRSLWIFINIFIWSYLFALKPFMFTYMEMKIFENTFPPYEDLTILPYFYLPTSPPSHHTAKAIPFIYSFFGNCAASAPISTFMCLWVIYIYPGSVHIFPPAETAAPLWEYIIRSQTHECGNWGWGRAIPKKGIYKRNCLCSVVWGGWCRKVKVWQVVIFLFWEYLLQIFGIFSLQCTLGIE